MTRGRNARRASFACVRCKKDKRRCDISSTSVRDPDGPRCTACRSRNEHCEVRFGDDRRSNRQTQDNKALHDRIAALEETIKNMAQPDTNSGHDPSTEPDPQLGLQAAADAPSHHQSTFSSPADPASPNGSSQRRTSPREATESWSNADEPRSSKLTASLSFSGQPGFSVQDMLECFPSGMDEVAAPATKVGGQTSTRNRQYFGSACLFPYCENGLGTRGVGEDRNGVATGEETNHRWRAVLEASPEPEPIVAHLLDLFWKWQSCHLLVIDRAIFLRHRRNWDESGGNGDRNFYTPCLLYAILSMASMISPDEGVRRYSCPGEGVAGEKFAKRSRALLEIEMEHPTIATVQTALILGSRYGAMLENSLGWTYSGIAFRIASKLALHLNCGKAVASGHMTAETAKLRNTVFWGCDIEDNLFSSYCSRPTFFMNWDITTPLPERPIDLDAAEESSNRASLLHRTSCLSLIISRIMINLYGRRRQSTAAELYAFASQAHNDLWHWYQDLPVEFALVGQDDKQVPTSEVLILHMHFYFALTFLHRPFLQFSRVLDELTNLDGSTSTSTGACAIAATNITRLAQKYQRFYSIRQVPSPTVHFVFIAGTIHLVNFRIAKLDCHYQLFQSCLGALSEMHNSYPIADKASSVLRDLIDGWEPTKEADQAIATRMKADVNRHVNQGSQQIDRWLETEKLPLMETSGRPGFEDCVLDGQALAATFSLPQDLDMSGPLNYESILSADMSADWLTERALFDTFYGDNLPLG